MNHMTCDHDTFSHLLSKYPKTTITNANGVSSPTIGVGTIPLSPNFNHQRCLVLSLNCNILSISQLTKSYDCVAIFFPTYRVLQDIHTKERIDSG